MKERRVRTWLGLKTALVEREAKQIVVADPRMVGEIAPIHSIQSNRGMIAGIVGILGVCAIGGATVSALTCLGVKPDAAASVSTTISLIGLAATLILIKDFDTIEIGPDRLVFKRASTVHEAPMPVIDHASGQASRAPFALFRRRPAP